MDARVVGVAWTLTCVLLAACGSVAPASATVSSATVSSAAPERAEAPVELRPPGSRITVTAPPARRVAHTLRYHTDHLELRFSDATVEPGTERAVAEAYLAQLTAEDHGQIAHRPFGLDGAEGLQITVRDMETRTRALTLWRDGAISRLSISHHPRDAAAAERVIESLRFDATVVLDPRAALGIDADPVEDLPLLRVSTEQMIFREAGHAVAFPSLDAAVDVTYVAYDAEAPDDRQRGRLLGARFVGLPMETPRVEPIDGGHLAGFAMLTQTEVRGAHLALMGAYLELPEGALLVRASVDAERASEWTPRFVALVRSLRER